MSLGRAQARSALGGRFRPHSRIRPTATLGRVLWAVHTGNTDQWRVDDALVPRGAQGEQADGHVCRGSRPDQGSPDEESSGGIRTPSLAAEPTPSSLT